MGKPLITSEACRYLGLTRAGFYLHKRKGRIKHIGQRSIPKTGNRVFLYDTDDLDKLRVYLNPNKKIKNTPDEDEVTEYQSVIHWSKKFRRESPTKASPGRTLEYVPVTCSCGKTCEVNTYEFRRKGNPRLPLCKWCAVAVTRRKGTEHERWAGGKVLRMDGYINIHKINLTPKEQELFKSMFQKSLYIMEHRLVMARHLGRPLKRNEHIHHINKNKQDNRLSNLKLLSPQGHIYEELVWARSEIKRLKSILDKQGIEY